MLKWVKKNRFSSLLVVILLILGIGLFYQVKTIKPKKEVNKEVGQIEEFGYKSYSNDTKYIKNKFKDLEKVLTEDTINQDDYAKVLTELFILDFYTLDNKMTNKNVGGLQFIHPDIKENFILKATDTYYKGLESNIIKKRTQVLPVVKKVFIDKQEQTSTVVGNINDPIGYKIQASWEYEKSLGYQTKGTFYLVHKDQRLYIIKIGE